MRFRRHLTYANVMATIAVFGVVAGGGAYAASKIDTPDIANKAITAKKLDDGAVKAPKLRSGAVTNEKLADGAVEGRNLSQDAPLAMAGITVHNGDIRGWFNRFSSEGQPTMEHSQPGVYEFHLPGLGGPDGLDWSGLELLNSVSLDGTFPQSGEVSSRWSDCRGGGCLHPIVFTFDSAGNPADRSFTYLVYRLEHGVL